MITSMRGYAWRDNFWPWLLQGHSDILDGIFLYLAQIITSIRVCVSCNDLWPLHLSSRSFSHDFAIILLKYGTSCSVHSTVHLVQKGFNLAQMISVMRECVTCNDFRPWPISLWSFSHDFAIKLLKYGTFCRVCFIAYTVQDGSFSFLCNCKC